MQRSNENTKHEEEEPKKATSGAIWTGLLATGGLIAAGAGLALAFGPSFVPELGWIAKQLGRVGFDSGVVFGTGVLCTALSVVLGRFNAVGGQLRAAEDSMEIVTTLGIGMRHLVERMTRLHAELGELKEGNRAVMHMVKEQSETESTGMQVDATFRLAASVDQLDRKIEERLGAHDTNFGGRFTEFDGRITELSTSVAGSQDQLRGLTATCCQLGEQLAALEETTRRMAEANEAQLEATKQAATSTPSIPMASTPKTELELDTTPKFESKARTTDEELEIVVDLEDEVAEPNENEVPHPASFDWDKVDVPESVRSEGLGVLDEIEDEAPLDSSLHPGGQAHRGLGLGGSDADDEGLGLLDSLDDLGSPIPADAGKSENTNPVDRDGEGKLKLSLESTPSLLPSETPEPKTETLDEAWEAFKQEGEE